MSTAALSRSATDETIARLQAEATRRTGCEDFGPDDYLEPLARLVEEVGEKPGRAFLEEDIVGGLMGRLVREASWQANPGWRERAIVAPLVICGIPRTGTTALHKLLSADPQFQGLDHWLSAWPKPRPPRETWADEPGFQHAVEVLERRYANAPGSRLAHEVIADEVDECLEVLRLDFVTNRYPSMTSLPRYDRWFQAQDETPSYHRLADTLRLIGLHDERTWLLKNPGHFGHVDQLLAVFPDARVVITHRDPVKSIGSLCSVLEQTHRLADPEEEPAIIGQRELAYWASAKRATERSRALRSSAQFLDVDHAAFHADPIGVVRGIYARFGLVLAAEVETRMRDWLAANPAGKLGEHRYALERYGLSEDQVREALGSG